MLCGRHVLVVEDNGLLCCMLAAQVAGVTRAMNHTPRIQIVEDQYFVAMDCEICLQLAGFECTGMATTADHAYALAERDQPDLIIMDIRLGSHIDGVDAAIEIFERLGIRCIFASGHADKRVREQAQRAHPLGWLDKPYSNEQLVRAVQHAINELDGNVDSDYDTRASRDRQPLTRH